ncbi:hypothetical protein KSF78_0009708 [Schistosoma japonicum]|nr:hypothetical protein KSF78_0009708 [Schistosoma japonicum]
MNYIINFILKRQNLQSKLSYTTMVWILFSVLTIISITITLTLEFTGKIIQKGRMCYNFHSCFHAICISVAEGYPVINVSVLIKVGAWFGALFLCSLLATIGIFIKSDLRNHSIAFLIYCAVVLICNNDSVYWCLFWKLSKLNQYAILLALGIFVAGVLAVMIPVAVCFGQLTFSQFIHGYNPDYCLAVLVLLTTVLGFFVIFSVEVNLLKNLTASKTMNVSLYVL